MKYLYLFIDFFTVIIPLLFSFHPKINFYKEWRWFFPANLITGVLFIIWDIIFTKNGVWGFNENYLTGVYFYNLPVEELLFFICIPYACVFTYYCITRFHHFKWKLNFERAVILGLSVSLLILGLYHYSKSYTAATFISLSIVLIALKFVFKIEWLPQLLTIYAFLLIPFSIVNGILTGSWIEQPVVWYNNQENIGLRLLTIPVEDVFYGFELILLNVFFYHLLKSTSSRVHIAL